MACPRPRQGMRDLVTKCVEDRFLSIIGGIELADLDPSEAVLASAKSPLGPGKVEGPIVKPMLSHLPGCNIAQ